MQPNVPTLAPGRSRFNTRYFDRDTRRAPLEQQIELSGSDAKLIASTEVIIPVIAPRVRLGCSLHHVCTIDTMTVAGKPSQYER